jgi:hypothetical protein
MRTAGLSLSSLGLGGGVGATAAPGVHTRGEQGGGDCRQAELRRVEENEQWALGQLPHDQADGQTDPEAQWEHPAH